MRLLRRFFGGLVGCLVGCLLTVLAVALAFGVVLATSSFGALLCGRFAMFAVAFPFCVVRTTCGFAFCFVTFCVVVRFGAAASAIGDLMMG